MFEIKENLNQQVEAKLQENFSTAIISSEMMVDMLCFTVKKESLIDIFKYLYKEESLKFQFLTTLCGVHYPERNELGVVYHLHSLENNVRIRIKTFTSVESPIIPSLTSIFASANWQERETYDFFGIIFEGHPNLKRILNVDEMTDFPLRKEFPLEDQTREDKDDTKFGR